MRKRGISQIITTILIILLVLAAIIIVWNAVKKTIEKSSEEIGIKEFEFQAELAYSLISNVQMEVEVQRKAGGGEISGIKIIFTDSDGMTYSVDKKLPADEIPKELETKEYTINVNDVTPTLISFSTIEKVSVYFYYKINDEERMTNVLDTAKMSVETTTSECTEAESCEGANPCKQYERECTGGVLGDCSLVNPETNKPDETSCHQFGKCSGGECDLISWWKFDEGAGTTASDETGANDGVITGAVWVTDDKGTSLSFPNEDDNVNIGDIPTPSTVTWSFWIKANSVSGIQRILDKYATTSAGREYRIHLSGGEIVLQISQDGANVETRDSETANILENTWTHIVVVFYNRFFDVYKDGAIQSDNGDFLYTSFYNSATALWIGRDHSGTADFNGGIDDVMIFKRALTSTEIQTIYNAQNPYPST